jgi:MFS family permease
MRQEATQSSSMRALGPAGSTAILGASILVFVGLFSLASALPAVRVHFAGAPYVDLLTQLVGAMSGFSFAFGSLMAGRVITRFGYRQVYVVSLLAFAAAGAAPAVLPNLYAIIFTRVIVGLSAATILNAALVATSRLLSPPAQARMLGLQSIVASVAGITAFPVIGQLSGIDWRLPFAVHLMALIWVPLVMALPAGRSTDSDLNALPVARGVGVLILVTTVFVGMAVFISTIFGPLFLVGLGVTNTGLLSIPPTAAAIGGLIGSTLYLFLRSRVGLASTFAWALGAMTVGLATAGLATSVWGVAAGSFVAMAGGGAFSPNMNSAAIMASPENPGPALGLINSLFYGAMILFPLILSQFSAGMSGPRAALFGSAAFAGLLSIAFVVGGRFRQIPVDLSVAAREDK